MTVSREDGVCMKAIQKVLNLQKNINNVQTKQDKVTKVTRWRHMAAVSLFVMESKQRLVSDKVAVTLNNQPATPTQGL